MAEETKFEELIKLKKIDEVKELFTEHSEAVTKSLEEWNIEDHEANKRPVVPIEGRKDKKQWNIPLPWQKKIVNSSLIFSFGKPVKFIQESENTDRAFALFESLMDDVRIDAKNVEMAEKLLSETEVVRFFVPYRDNDADPANLEHKNSIRCLIWAKSLGDTIYTKFNVYGGLDMLARGYKVKVGDDNIEHFDIYTPNAFYYCTSTKGVWDVEIAPHIIKKNPVSYYKIPTNDWHNVQPIIKRREWLGCRKADTNDATADPILVLEGGVPISLPDSENPTKVVILENGAKASYLSPDFSVEMAKDERDTLDKDICFFTDTPYKLEEMVSKLGTTSGKSLEMMLQGPLMKSYFLQTLIFNPMFDREINIIKAIMATVIDTSLAEEIKRLKIKIEFGNPLPDDVKDLIDMLSIGTGGKPIMSQKTAVKLNKLVSDSDQEIIDLREEEASLNAGGDE